jgi:hypothetical protein
LPGAAVVVLAALVVLALFVLVALAAAVDVASAAAAHHGVDAAGARPPVSTGPEPFLLFV